MPSKEPIIMSWSGGKDSSFALFQLLKEGQYDIQYLLTTVYEPNRRVSMHGVPEALIIEQAKSIGIPLQIVYIGEKTHEEYENKMQRFLSKMKAEGIHKVAFGDIFLDDLKIYRENKMAILGMEALFPLWKQNTIELAKQFLKEGFKTHICSIDLSKMPESLIGVDFSTAFLSKLASTVDPCGENGEFHSFCYDGPIFNYPIRFTKNEIVPKTYEHDQQEYHYLFSDIS